MHAADLPIHEIRDAFLRAFRDPATPNLVVKAPTGSGKSTQLPQFALESVGAFEDAVGMATELGFTDVVCHWPRPEGPYAGSEAVLEAVAGTFSRE